MRLHSSSPKLISLAFGVFVLIFALGFQVFAVWTSPASAPPSGNISPPLTVGPNPQIKSGGLWVNSLGVDGGIRINGGLTPPSCNNLSVGTIWNVPYNPLARTEGRLDICLQNGNGDYAWQKIIRGVGPSFIDVNPGTLGFGSLDQNSFADLSFTVTNTGEGPLVGSLSGLASPFSCVSGCSYNLTAGQNQLVIVRFAPIAWNSFNDAADLSGGGGASVIVSGTGNPLPADINVVPTTIDFGSILKGTSLDKTFTVSNAGEVTLTGSVNGLVAPFSCITTPDCNYSLVGGANKILTIRFAPTTDGSFSESASFSGGGDALRNVSGVGTLPPPTISSVIPSQGYYVGGTEIQISSAGNDFVGSTVTVGGNNAIVASVTSNTIIAKTPTGIAGSASVKVTNFDGQTGAKTGGFTYLTSGSLDQQQLSFGSDANGLGDIRQVFIAGVNGELTTIKAPVRRYEDAGSDIPAVLTIYNGQSTSAPVLYSRAITITKSSPQDYILSSVVPVKRNSYYMVRWQKTGGTNKISARFQHPPNLDPYPYGWMQLFNENGELRYTEYDIVFETYVIPQ